MRIEMVMRRTTSPILTLHQ